MKIYRIGLNENFTTYSIKGYADYEECEDVDKLLENWKEKKLTELSKRKEGDLGYCFLPMGHMILSETAVEKIKPYINCDEIEFLPLKKGKKTFYILHGIKADKLTCDIVQKGIEMHYVFNENELKACGIESRLVIKAEMNFGVLSDLFFTEKFVDILKQLELKGVDFEVEWDSEADSKTAVEQKEDSSIPNGNQSWGAESEEVTVEAISQVIGKKSVEPPKCDITGMSSQEIEELILAAIVESTDAYCKSMLTNPDDKVHEILVNYFDDGEFIDLGVRVTVCDKDTDNFRDDYYSFTVHDERLKPIILEYLKSFGSSKRYSQLKKLARETKKVIKEKGKYVSKKTYFSVEAYD